ncbi:hypothetical protein RB195_024652 [Necator americanus]|uniref:Uncharacterized protein n=1 Tax=Necator americanus TaxID=51031 RepID=A0ABR1EPC5_NECAM
MTKTSSTPMVHLRFSRPARRTPPKSEFKNSTQDEAEAAALPSVQVAHRCCGAQVDAVCFAFFPSPSQSRQSSSFASSTSESMQFATIDRHT